MTSSHPRTEAARRLTAIQDTLLRIGGPTREFIDDPRFHCRTRQTPTATCRVARVAIAGRIRDTGGGHPCCFTNAGHTPFSSDGDRPHDLGRRSEANGDDGPRPPSGRGSSAELQWLPPDLSIQPSRGNDAELSPGHQTVPRAQQPLRKLPRFRRSAAIDSPRWRHCLIRRHATAVFAVSRNRFSRLATRNARQNAGILGHTL